MAYLSHRRLVTYPQDIQAKAERITHTYGSIDKRLFPDTIGAFWQPFHHNYAYGLSKVEVVANYLAEMKAHSTSVFLELYNEHLADTWQDDRRKQTYEGIVLAMGDLNSDQSLVMYAEHSMNDQKKLVDVLNTWHVVLYAVNLFTVLSIFGFNKTMNITVWIFLLGIASSEAMSQFLSVAGSSIITFAIYGAILTGLMLMKRWNIFYLFTFVSTLYLFAEPLLTDPPLKSKYFIAGKQILHLAHFVGAALGVVIVLLVS